MSDKIKTWPVRVEYSDGHYWLESHTVGHAAHNLRAVVISQGEWDCYKAFQKLENYWHDRLRTLSNEQYALDHPEDVALLEAANALGVDEDTLDREPPVIERMKLSNGARWKCAAGPCTSPSVCMSAERCIIPDAAVPHCDRDPYYITPQERAEIEADREPKDPTPITSKTFTPMQMAALEKLGWQFLMTGPSEWEWRKIGHATLAVQGDETWVRDVARVCR